MLIFLLLLLAFCGIWLNRLQDIALTAQHAGRLGAFDLTRRPDVDKSYLVRQFFAERAASWKTFQGQSMVPDKAVRIQVGRLGVLPAEAQPGGTHSQAGKLRPDWGIQDRGVANVALLVRPEHSVPQPAAVESILGRLSNIDALPLTIRRHTAILTGAGHAKDAEVAHRRAASSTAGWRLAADNSQGVARQIDKLMMPVDAAWQRPRLALDWFGKWQGKMP